MFLAKFLPSYTRRQKIAAAILFGSYLLTALIGYKLFAAPAVIFPAAGVALAGLVLGGLSLWPMILFASIVQHLIIGTNIYMLVVLSIAHTLQAAVGAYILRKLGFDSVMRHVRDMIVFMAVALGVSMIVPTIGFGSWYLRQFFNPTGIGFSVTWGSWWTGMLFSLLVVSPAFIRWLARPRFRRTTTQIIEISAIFIILFVSNYLIFFSDINRVGHISVAYIILIPFMWMALRIGPRFLTLGMLITGIMAILGAYTKFPSVSELDLGTRLFELEIFINIVAFIFYTLVGIEEERGNAVRAYRSHISNLEGTLNEVSTQDKAKSEFIALLAHELRNPLSPIVSGLELLRFKNIHDETVTDTLNVMDDKVHTIKRLLDDLLDISRVSRQKLRLQKEKINLCKTIEAAIKSVEHHFHEREQTLHINIPTKSIYIFADPVRIEQIVMNLLSNASKYSYQGGTVWISVKQDGSRAEIRVLDNGVGIEQDLQSRIFEPFLQIELGKRTSEGLGIGLSLTQNLVQMHGGNIRAESSGKGRGSEFIVELPVYTREDHPNPSHDNTKKSDSPELNEGSYKVLVVDDNKAAAQGIGKLLGIKGYKVEYAHTGEEALDQALKWKPKAILLDIGLPDMDGYKVAKKLRADMKFKGGIIALTGYGQIEDRQRAYEAGCNAHLTKPIGISDVDQALKEII